jgi:chemotaxis protein CheD
MNEIFLQPGEYYVGDASHRIRTILGSCVSITLWHRQKLVGAMSHFLLATRATAHSGDFDARYGDEALELMLRELAVLGVAAGECEAKLFGGGNMFPEHPRSKETSIGLANGEAAREFLRLRGIRVTSESLYGVGHRQVIFDIGTGHVWSRQVKPKQQPASESRKP